MHVRNNDKLSLDDQCRHAIGLKQEAHLQWTRDHSRINWEEFVCCQVRVNVTYSEAKYQVSDRNSAVLMNVQPLTSGGPLLSLWCSASLFLPPHVMEGGGLVCESVGKADLLLDHFDSRQFREAVDQQLTCHPSPSLNSFPFRTREARRLLLDLDPCSTDPFGMFPLFTDQFGMFPLFTDPFGMFPLLLKRTVDVMAPPSWCSVSGACSSGQFPGLETGQCQSNRKGHRLPLLLITDRFP